jgi:hypothetical protein
VSGAPSNALVDGNGGIDNNYGSQLIPMLQSLSTSIESQANAQITNGAASMVLRLQNFDPTLADSTNVPGELYVVGAPGFTPTFASSDAWPVSSTSLASPSSVGAPSNALARFPHGFVKGGHWVSGTLGEAAVPVVVPIGFGPVSLPLASPFVTFKLSDGSDGTLAGAARASDFVAGIVPIAESLGICPSDPNFQSIALSFTQASDLVIGAPSLQDTSKTCDAISIALGFTVVPVAPSTKVHVATPSTSSCAGDAALPGGG